MVFASQNLMNASKRSGGTSRFKGVFTNKEVVCTNSDRRQAKALLESEAQAALAYNNAAIQHFAEFACLIIIPVENVIDM